MLIEADDRAFENLAAGNAPNDLTLAQADWETRDVLLMLQARAREIRQGFAPAAWLIVEQGELVGMCSILKVSPASGSLEIGYGVAPACRAQGVCTRAIAEIVLWARHDPRVAELCAETIVSNIASQRVLQRNGFARVGERVSAEDGPVICWAIPTRFP